MAPRFELYVKQSSSGGDRGSCPFCMRVFMFMLYKVKKAEIQTVPVDFSNKSEHFLALNPAGTTPVLIDHGAGDKVIADSGLILEYIESLFPNPPMNLDSKERAVEVTEAIFKKFAAYMTNKDPSKSGQLRQELEAELAQIEGFLKNEGKGRKYLLGDSFSGLDCTIFPRLFQVKIAGKAYKGIDINGKYPAIAEYVDRASLTEQFQSISPIEDDVVIGWARHGPIKEC